MIYEISATHLGTDE